MAFHAINNAILNVYSNKFFATSQIIHISLAQKTSRLRRDSRNNEIYFWVFFPKTTKSGKYAFLAAIPAGEIFSLGVSIFSAEQLQHKTDNLSSYQLFRVASFSIGGP